MKIFGAAVGLVALLSAGSASAAVVYDSLSGQTAANRLLLNSAHAPEALFFTSPGVKTVQSIAVQLATGVATTQTMLSADTGSVLVYLVPAAQVTPGFTAAAVTASLTPMELIGSILDSSLTAMNTPNNITFNTHVTIGAGDYAIVLTDSNPGALVGWNQITAAGASSAIGLPAGTLTAYNAGGTITAGFPVENPSVTGGDFMAQIQAPEPASLAVLGVGMAGLGLLRRRGAKKSAK